MNDATYPMSLYRIFYTHTETHVSAGASSALYADYETARRAAHDTCERNAHSIYYELGMDVVYSASDLAALVRVTSPAQILW